MTCERTNDYEAMANVAKFERLLIISVRKHIRQHILPSVRVAIVSSGVSDQWIVGLSPGLDTCVPTQESTLHHYCCILWMGCKPLDPMHFEEPS